MPGFRFILTFALLVAVSQSAHGGIYCSLDQLPYPIPTTFSVTNSKLADIRAPRNVEKGQQQKRDEYLQHANDLEAKGKAGGLTLEEQIDLSGVYLRLNRNDDAIQVLKTADQSNALVLTHLATAYHQREQPLWDRAIFYQQQALKAWPAVSPRWSLQQLTWYRRAEQYYLELLRLRHQETLANPNKQTYETVDALFPLLRLETAEGVYELGGLPKKGDRPTEELPQDGLTIVTQLLFWLPFDNRLTWLYGELLNQRGEVVGAEKVLRELVETRQLRRAVPKMYLHYRALQDGVRLWNNRRELLWATRLPQPFVVPGVGELGLEGASMLALASAKEGDEDPTRFTDGLSSWPPGPTPTLVPIPSPEPTNSWLPDWRTVVVSFAAGMIVMALLLLQWREWSRRRALSMTTRRQLTS